jgi:hypothetical protein
MALAELDDHCLGVGALLALERAQVLVVCPLGWLDLRQRHWQPACRTSPLTDRRLSWVEFVWLRHDTTSAQAYRARGECLVTISYILPSSFTNWCGAALRRLV